MSRRIIVLLGPPGAGKGTLAVELARRLRIPHVSTGEVFRAAIRAHTSLGQQVESVIEQGLLVSDDLTVGMVRERLAAEDAVDGAVLDGFPRTLPQAVALSDFAPVTATLDLVVSNDQIIQRLSGRRTCSNCGAVYHLEHRPTKVADSCDVCGHQIGRRPDDEPEAIVRRLKVYEDETAELEGYFRARGLLREVDAAAPPATVLERAVAALQDPQAVTDRA